MFALRTPGLQQSVHIMGGCPGRCGIIIGYTTAVQSVPMTTKVVYSIQHYLIKLVSDLRQVGGFLRFPPPIKLTTTA
jgi:hypothetical protein